MQGQDKHFLNLLHTLEYFCDRLPGYDEHCPSISRELYHEFVCKKCEKYFPTKAFIRKHIKIMHLSKRGKLVQYIINDEQQFITPIENYDIVEKNNKIADNIHIKDSKKDGAKIRNLGSKNNLHFKLMFISDT